MNILSIDPSSHSTGTYSRVNGKNYFLSLCYDGKKGHNQILAALNEYFRERCTKKIYDVAFIEGYALAKMSRSTHTQPELGGAIKAAITSNGVPIITVGIMTWKWLTIGHEIKKPHDEKEAVEYIEAVNKEYDIRCYTPDEADAYMIYYACVKILKEQCKMTDARVKIRDQLLEIKKGKGETK